MGDDAWPGFDEIDGRLGDQSKWDEYQKDKEELDSFHSGHGFHSEQNYWAKIQVFWEDWKNDSNYLVFLPLKQPINS